MTTGSGIFSGKKAAVPHLNTGEVADLRQDIRAEFLHNAAICVEEFLAPAAAGVALISAVAQSQVAAGRSATLLALAANISPPRNITVSTGAGGTPADAPATVVITGKDINGAAMTETLNISQTAATVAGLKAFASVSSIVEAAGEGTGAALSYGIGLVIGLSRPIKVRGGQTTPLPIYQIANGVAVVTGTFTTSAVGAPNGTYAPAAAANGALNYCLYYEYDATLNRDA